MTTLRLFGGITDPVEIERHIADDRFVVVARVAAGIEANLYAFVSEIAGLLDIYRALGRDEAPLLNLATLLFQRKMEAAAEPDMAFVGFFIMELGLALDYAEHFQRRVAARRAWLALSPEEREKRRARAWIEAYRAGAL